MGGTTKRLRLIYGDLTLGVAGEGYHCIFNYMLGGLESLVKDGREWIYRAPRPTFWRALTDNDRGSRFHLQSGMWLAADTFIRVTGARVAVDGQDIPLPIAPENNRYTPDEFAGSVSLTFDFETITVPAARVAVTYALEAGKGMTVTAHYFGQAGLPQLPVFGLRFIMPTMARGFTYEGLSGETYPDRMDGGIPGVYHVDGLPVTPYLVPQECGMHMDTRWVEIERDTQLSNVRQDGVSTLRIEQAGKPFAFSCLPYTAGELENATHQEELPPARRTVLCVCGAVRGVGGINSWGADVERAYHIDAAQDHEVSFVIAL